MPNEELSDFEDVRPFTLEEREEAELLARQTECTFVWSNKEGHPVGVIMSFVFRDGKFWLTASAQRARMRAIRRDPRVSIVVTSKGSGLPIGRSLTYKGTVTLHEDERTKSWFYPELAGAVRPNDPAAAESFARFLDSPDRLVIEVTPEGRIGFDGQKMWRVAPSAAPSGDR